MPDNFPRLIEVVGSAKYELVAQSFPVELIFSSTSKGRVDRYKLTKAADGFVEALREQGFDLDRLSHAGTKAQQWFFRSQRNNEEIRLRMLCETAQEAFDLTAACAHIPYDGAELSIDAQSPVFEDDSEKRQDAFVKATQHAIDLATQIAEAAGAKLGDLYNVKELSDLTRGSGYGSDHDWGMVTLSSPLAGGAGRERGAQLEADVTACRTVNLLARFQIE